MFDTLDDEPISINNVQFGTMLHLVLNKYPWYMKPVDLLCMFNEILGF